MTAPLLHRLTRQDHPAIPFTLNGQPVQGRAGDSLLTAILTLTDRLRRSDRLNHPRAGFCQMGACQDCWVTLADGQRLRACTTPLTAGMAIVTGDTP